MLVEKKGYLEEKIKVIDKEIKLLNNDQGMNINC